MSWKEIVAKVAPTLGGALGGPLGGMAANAIVSALDLPAGSKDSQIEQAIAADPNSLLKLKQAEIDFETKMRELEIDVEKIFAEDRDSARKREISLGDKTPTILAILIIAGYIWLQYFILTHTIGADMRELVMRTLGVVDAALGMVLTYYFGSSSSSRVKDQTIARMSK